MGSFIHSAHFRGCRNAAPTQTATLRDRDMVWSGGRSQTKPPGHAGQMLVGARSLGTVWGTDTAEKPRVGLGGLPGGPRVPTWGRRTRDGEGRGGRRTARGPRHRARPGSRAANPQSRREAGAGAAGDGGGTSATAAPAEHRARGRGRGGRTAASRAPASSRQSARPGRSHTSSEAAAARGPKPDPGPRAGRFAATCGSSAPCLRGREGGTACTGQRRPWGQTQGGGVGRAGRRAWGSGHFDRRQRGQEEKLARRPLNQRV